MYIQRLRTFVLFGVSDSCRAGSPSVGPFTPLQSTNRSEMVGRIWSLFSRRLRLVHRHVSWRSASHVDGEIFVLFSCREIR